VTLLKTVGSIIIVLALPLAALIISWYQAAPLVKPLTFLSPTPSPATFQPFSPTLATIFAEDHFWTATLSAEKLTTLLATGDVIPARSVNVKTQESGDWRWPFLKTADVLRQADLTVINLETPLLSHCPLTNEGMIFCGNAQHLEGLQFAGIDVVNLANNHSGNWDQVGIRETANLLQNQGMAVTGTTDNLAVVRVNNLTFAFLGYNDIPEFVPGIAQAQEETIKQEVAQAKAQSDIVVVAFHWGVEYTSQPTPRQITLAHLAVDSGADLVIGNHPHWIQPVEIYRDKLIMYAHGNFSFDQMWSQPTREGVVGRYTFWEDQLIAAEFLPIFIEDYGQPHWLEGQPKTAILEQFKLLSFQLVYQ
jgi:poly-gamma-glutamate synthesis protein (capsule biosynthesis protein)